MGVYQLTRPAALHHLIIALHIGGDKDDFSPKAVPHLLEEFDRVWPSTTFLRVPEDHALGLDVFVNQARNRRAESLLLIRADPDQEPVRALNAGRQGSPDACSRADADSTLEHGRGVADASC